MAMTNLGSGIWLYNRRTRLAILKLTVPATIIRSAWRGVARQAPAPKRSMSKREAPVAIISMAQQARPNVIGHMLDSRAQLTACSSVVVMTASSLKNPSSQPMLYAPAPPGGVSCGQRSFGPEARQGARPAPATAGSGGRALPLGSGAAAPAAAPRSDRLRTQA